MDPFFTELLKYGVGGLLAAIFFKRELDEKKAHEVTRAALIASLLDRLQDSKESVTKVTDPLSTMAHALDKMSDKIEVSKGNR
jgi:hypothetical protein